MKILVWNNGVCTNYSSSYAASQGAITVNDAFNKTARTVTASFSLTNPSTVPVAGSLVELYRHAKTDTGFANSAEVLFYNGLIKSVEKRGVAKGATVYSITVESLEMASLDTNLIISEEYYSTKFTDIVKDIVAKYLPHLNATAVALPKGITDPVLQKVHFVNRKPIEAINALCAKVACFWYVKPVAYSVGQQYCGTVVLGDLANPTNTDTLTITGNNQLKSIDISFADNLDKRVNDLYAYSDNLLGPQVLDMLTPDGFEGKYRLTKTPYKLSETYPIMDEFSSDTEFTNNDNWKTATDPSQNLRVSLNRLQFSGDSIARALISKKLVSTSHDIRGRLKEVEFTTLPASGCYYAAGFHVGTTSAAISNIVAGIRILGGLHAGNPTVEVIHKDQNGLQVFTDTGYAIQVSKSSGVAYQFQFELTTDKTGTRIFSVYVQNAEEMEYGIVKRQLIYSGTAYGFPNYVAFCPVIVSGTTIAGTIIQASVANPPAVSAMLEEHCFVESVKSGVVKPYRANWKKHNLKNQTVTIYDKHGNQIQNTTIASNDDTTLTLTSPLSDASYANAFKLVIAWRPLIVGTDVSNDYEANAFVTVENDVPMFEFYGNKDLSEIPAGRLYVQYTANVTDSLRMMDQAGYAPAKLSGLPNDTGMRKAVEKVSDISTYEDMFQYAQSYITSQRSPYTQGTVESNNWLLDSYPMAGMTISFNNVVCGKETISTDPTFVNSLTVEDQGGKVLRYSFSLGSYKTFVHELFLDKLNVLRENNLIIDDESDAPSAYPNEFYTDSDFSTLPGAPSLVDIAFDENGVSFTWERSDPSVSSCIFRWDSTAAGTTVNYNQYGQYTLTIPKVSVTKRRYVLYVHDYNPASPLPTKQSIYPMIASIENRQPSTAWSLGESIADGTVILTLQPPFDSGVTMRTVYINNAYTSSVDLETSDKIINLNPYDKNVQFVAYDTTMYVTIVDKDAYSNLDKSPNRYDRAIVVKPVPRPPKKPKNFDVFTKSDAGYEHLQENQIAIKVEPNNDDLHGKAELFHVQFSKAFTGQTAPFPPFDEGQGSCIVDDTASVTIAVQSVLSTVQVGRLLAIGFTYTLADNSTETATQVHRITAVTAHPTLPNYNLVTVDAPFILDKGTYTCTVWNADSWYNYHSDGYDTSYVEYKVSTTDYSFASNNYTYVYTFDMEYTGYCRIYAMNRYGMVTDEAASIEPFTTKPITGGGGIDKTPAATVTGFNVTLESFTTPDHVGLDYCTVAFTKPTDARFSYVKIFASEPVLTGNNIAAGGTGRGAAYAGEGYYTKEVCDVYETGEHFIVKSTGQHIVFYAVSVNTSGYYDPDWYGKGQFVATALLTLDDSISPPAAVTGLSASTNPVNDVSIVVKWNRNTELNFSHYELQYCYADTNSKPGSPTWLVANEHLLSNICDFSPQNLPVESLKGKYFWFRVLPYSRTATPNTFVPANNWVETTTGVMLGSVAIINQIGTVTNMAIAANPWNDGIDTWFDVSVSWTPPIEASFGGVDLYYQTGTSREAALSSANIVFVASVPKGDNSTVFSVKGKAGTVIVVSAICYDQIGIWASGATAIPSNAASIDPSLMTLTVPTPSIVSSVNGVNNVALRLSLPDINGRRMIYLNSKIYVGTTTNPTTVVMEKLPVPLMHLNSNPEQIEYIVPYDKLISVIPTYVKGQSLYWKVQTMVKTGDVSSLSSVYEAHYISDVVTNTSVDFNTDEQIMVVAPNFPSDSNVGSITVYFNKPTVTVPSGVNTAYQAHIQVVNGGTITDSQSKLLDDTVEFLPGSVTFMATKGNAYTIRVRYRFVPASGSEWTRWYGTTKAMTSYTYLGLPADKPTDTAAVNPDRVAVSVSSAVGANPTMSMVLNTPTVSTTDNYVHTMSVIYTDAAQDGAEETRLQNPTPITISAKLLTTDNNTVRAFDCTSYSGTIDSTWIGRILEYSVVIGGVTQKQYALVQSIEGKLLYGNVGTKWYGGPNGDGVISLNISIPWWMRKDKNGKSFGLFKITYTGQGEEDLHNTFVQVGKTYSRTLNSAFASGSTLYYMVEVSNSFESSRSSTKTLTISNPTSSGISNAQSTANTAQSSAYAAQSTANAAQSTADTALTNVTTVINQTVNIRSTSAPSSYPSKSSGTYIYGVLTPNSTCNVTLYFTYTQGTNKADGFIVCYKKSTSAPAADDTDAGRYFVSMNDINSSNTSYSTTVTGLSHYDSYSFAIYAARKTDTGYAVNTSTNFTIANWKYNSSSDVDLELKPIGLFGYVTCNQFRVNEILPMRTMSHLTINGIIITDIGLAYTDCYKYRIDSVAYPGMAVYSLINIPYLTSEKLCVDMNNAVAGSFLKCTTSYQSNNKEAGLSKWDANFKLSYLTNNSCDFIFGNILDNTKTVKFWFMSVTNATLPVVVNAKTITLSGQTTISGGAELYGPINTYTSLTCYKAEDSTYAIEAKGSVFIDSTLTVSGVSTFNNTLTVNNTLKANSYSTVVSGNTYTGVTGMFTDLDGKTVTVKNGIVTNIF